MTMLTRSANTRPSGNGSDELSSPTRLSAAIFRLKAALLQCQRAAQDQVSHIQCHPQRVETICTHRIASSRTPLWTDLNPSEAWHQKGKIHNLQLAAERLNLSFIPANEIFSFWKQVGRASTGKGFVSGRMLQEGCMIPSVGGGLCQLSNAIYQVALDAGCTIVERHAHSRIVPSSATAAGRDATVAWNYIDLRFRSSHPLHLKVEPTTTHLHVSLWSNESFQPTLSTSPELLHVTRINNDHACERCGKSGCFRNHRN